MRVTAYSLAIALMACCATLAHSEIDVFMRAVGFALTGSDDADPKSIGDRSKCVFAIKNNIYHLNNVHVDRIAIQGWQRKQAWGVEEWVTVGLHGDDIVFEEITDPPNDNGSDAMRQMRTSMPEMFKPHHYTYKEHELHLDTNDQDRVKRAWEYVYAHGCIGSKSPF